MVAFRHYHATMTKDNELKMTLRLPPDVAEDLKWLTKQSRRSANSEVVYLIQERAARKRKELSVLSMSAHILSMSRQ